MNQGNSREIILKKIKLALEGSGKTPEPLVNLNTEVFVRPEEKDLSVVFAENLIKNMGEFVFIENEDELVSSFQALQFKKHLNNLYAFEPSILKIFNNKGVSLINTDIDFAEKADAGITTCEALIARTGSIFVSSAGEAGRRLSIYPPVHIVIAYTSQILYDIKDGITYLKKKYKSNIPSMLSLVTGPSRTADIEKTLVLGAHGPKELIVFLIDDTPSY
ncbi:MAG: lactate utilization protein C [Cytophagaceae bacterium]